MKDSSWKRAEIDSPCVNICMVHPDAQICTGCYRTIDEITRWSLMPAEERAEVTSALPDRKALLSKRRGGRRARLDR